MSAEHVPVLLNEAVGFLNAEREGCVFVDATLGLGGHSAEILKRLGKGSVLIAIDRDAQSLALAEKNIGGNSSLKTVHANFKDIDAVLESEGVKGLDGILFDLGVSSLHFDDAARGFSFMREAPLDMRLNQEDPLTASDVVNTYNARELVRVIREYGEEPHARKIAEMIIRGRPVSTTTQLADILSRAKRPGEKIHPATKVFQAIRIEVNGELDALREALEKTLKLMNPGGRIAVISFQSLEDRIVKQFFVRESRECVCEDKKAPCSCGHKRALNILTRKPLMAPQEEIAQNPRSRSAKLRAAERV
jgi:16S rRNA (cytosine1402-N4)-methyltransferase